MKLLLSVSEATPGGSTVNVAAFVEKTPRAAIIAPPVAVETDLVVTGKVATMAPAWTVTLGGTVAAEFWFDSVMMYPPAGAGPLMVTLPVDPLPPVTLAGLRVNESNPGGKTVRTAVLGEAPPICPETVTATVPGTTLGFVAIG